MRQLLDLAEWWSALGFDRIRPPWEVVLVEGYGGNAAAVILRWHHSLADGAAIVMALDDLLSPGLDGLPIRGPAAGTPQAQPGAAGLWPSPVPPADKLTAIPLNVAQAMQPLRGSVFHALQNPGRVIEQAILLVKSVRQMAPPIRGSRLFGNHGLTRRYELVEVMLTDLKRAAKACQTSLTTVFAATVLTACDDYHKHFADCPVSLPIALPISLRDNGHSTAGNMVGAVRLHAPLGATTVGYIQAVHDLIRQTKEDFADEFFPVFAEFGSYVPRPLARAMVNIACRTVDLWLTSVPGPRAPAHVAGALLKSFAVFGPRGLSACNATMVSHGGTCTIALHLDPEAITDIPLFCRLLRSRFEGLSHLGDKPVPAETAT